MKKHLYMLAMACLMSLPAFAQRGVHFGVQAGENIVGMVDDVKYGDVNYKYKPTFGFTYGVEGGWNFNDYLGLQAEFNIAQMGEKLNVEGNETYEERVKLNYIQVPVMFKIIGGDYMSRFSAMVGPQFGFLTSATMQRNDQGKYDGEPMDATNDFSKTDVGVVLTGGGDVTIHKNIYLNVHARFYYGFKEVNTKPNVLFGNPDEMDRLHNLSAGVFAGLHYLIRY
jgi:hypothetical protein